MPAHKLASVLDTSAAMPLHFELVGRADRGEPLELDGSAVTQIGHACLQVLASAGATAAARGLAYHLADPSPALREMAAMARFDTILDRVA